MLKKVVVLDNEIINVGEMDNMPHGAKVEEREMEYTQEDGWREVGWVKPLTLKERVEVQDRTILGLMDIIVTLNGGSA